MIPGYNFFCRYINFNNFIDITDEKVLVQYSHSFGCINSCYPACIKYFTIHGHGRNTPGAVFFSGFPIYLPELYPTRLRATGAGFCFNVGRVLASAAPFLTGWLVTALGGFGRAASAIALIYLAGLCLLPFAPETKGKPLPE